MGRGKKLIYKITVVFVCVIVLLIFFSNTIYNFNLPSVTVGFPESGEFLVSSVTGRGEVELVDKETYFSDMAGIIELYPKKGEYIRKGQLLFNVVPQYDDLSYELTRLQNEYSALEYRIEKNIADIDYYRQKILQAEIDIADSGPPDMTSYNAQLDTLSLRLTNLTAELKVLKTLYEINAATKSQLDDKENEIKALELQYAQVVQQMENALANYEKNKEQLASTAQKQLESLLDGYNKTVRDLEYQLKSLYIDRENLEIKIADIQKPASEVFKVYAANDCVIESLFTENGAYVRKYDKILTVGVINTTCKVMFKMAEDVDYIYSEMMVNLDVQSKRVYGIPGQVYSVKRETGTLMVEVHFPPVSYDAPPPSLRDMLKGVQLLGGETAELKLESNSGPQQCIVPNSAVHRDSSTSSYYVYTVVRKASALGYDYIAKKMYVTMALKNEYYAALSPIGFTFDDPIIFNSDRVINNGDRVRLADGADYVETR